MIEGSGLKRNDRVILKIAFDVYSYAFLWILKKFAQIDQFWKIGKNFGLVARPDFTRISLFRCALRIQRPKIQYIGWLQHVI